MAKLQFAAAAALLIAAGGAAAQYNHDDRQDRRGGWFDEEAACQEAVRHSINQRNRGNIDVDFRNRVRKEDIGSGRDRVRGAGVINRRDDSARFGYECIVDDRRNRVVTASYEVRGGDDNFR